MENLNIVFLVTNDLTYDRRMNRICSSLADAGATVTLAGRRLRTSKPYNAQKFEAVRLSCWFNKGVQFYAEYNIRFFFWLLTHRYDIACACDLDTTLAVRLSSWLKRKKTVYDGHEYFSEVPEVAHRPLVKSVWEWIARNTIPHFTLCYTVGEELAELMGKKYGVRFAVIRNIEPQAPLETLPPGWNERKKIILYQGALNVGRGLNACLQAMVHLPEWQLWLAGHGDITDQLKDLVIQLNIAERIKFLGWVAPEKLPQLMDQASININLREAGSLNDFYSLPNKFFDAIHAGLPSINMNYPEYAAICRKYPCSMLLDEVRVEKIVDAIQYIDNHPEAWQSMSEACIEASKEYSWEKEAQQLTELYAHL